MYLGTIIGKRFGFKLTAFLAMLCFGGCTLIVSFIENYWVFMLVYSIIPGIALGIAYIIPLHCGWAYFPKRKGLVTGTISMAFGLSASIFNIVATKLVNPNN